MCLLLTLLAAVVSTLLWYVNDGARKLRISTLCWLFWGAGILWLVDLGMTYRQTGAQVFLPSLGEVVQDTLLGIAVITFALILWIVELLVRDPLGRFSSDRPTAPDPERR